MPTLQHAEQEQADGLHPIVAFNFPNEADRLANTNRTPLTDTGGRALSLRVGHIVRQVDTNEFYIVQTTSPLVYDAVGSGGGGGEVVAAPTPLQSPFTITTETVVICGTAGGGVTVNLPAGTDGRRIRIVNTSSNNNVTVVRNGSDLLYGGSSTYAMTGVGFGNYEITLHFSTEWAGWW